MMDTRQRAGTAPAESGWTPREKFRFPAMRPSVPEPARWLPYLARSYEAKWFTNFGPVAHQFEQALTARFACPGEAFVVVNNCTAAITAALIAMKVRGRVAVPAFTFQATAAAVIMAGLEPFVLDVDPETWTLDAGQLELALKVHGCAAAVPVVPFGIAQDLARHLEICARYGCAVVIDNASGLGGPIVPLANERCVEVYSMHATKPFAVGEAGAIRAPAAQTAALRRALNFGLDQAEAVEGEWGINGKLPEVSAAIGLAVLEEFSEVVAKRQRVARRYVELLRSYGGLQFVADVTRGPWQGFPILLPSPAFVEQFRIRAAAFELNIRRYYRPTIEDWPHTTKLGPCPHARMLSDRMISLPIYSDMREDEVEAILVAVGELLQALGIH